MKLKMHLPVESAILLGISLDTLKMYLYMDIHSSLIIIAKNCRQPNAF